MPKGTRIAWCVACDGPTSGDENGCYTCRRTVCSDCGDLTTVMLVIAARRGHHQLCSVCWRAT